MSLFGNKSEGGTMDVIRCDEPEYLVWKWRPSTGPANSTRKENAIRWGSSLRVKDGEVAVFVYQQPDGPIQDYIEGPFDATLKTANLPLLAPIVSLAYAGNSPFQAEVYFINLAGNIRIPFGIPSFDVADPRFLDFVVPVQARGSILFNIRDYKGFIKKHRLVHFEIEEFKKLIREAVTKYVKAAIANAPAQHQIPVLQIERKLLEVNELVLPSLRRALEEDYGVDLRRFDLDTIEIDKSAEGYGELRRVTAGLQTEMLEAQNEQQIASQWVLQEHQKEVLALQRQEAQRLQALRTESQHLTAHQMNLQADVLKTAAEGLGRMGATGGGGGGINPVGLMTGMAVGGAMGQQMAGMMHLAGQGMQQTLATPPPLPKVYHVALNGQNAGPFADPELRELIRTGKLTRATLVWKPGMADWAPAGGTAELDALFPQEPPPIRPSGANPSAGGAP